MEMLKFKALADETRLRLVNILFHYELSVNELTQILAMGQSRVSRHLKILSEASLLRSRRDGLWVFYSAPPSGENTDFLRAMLPFFPDSQLMRDDMLAAARIVEERATRARQFFNEMAEKWDDLNREVLGDFDLPAKVAAAMPEDCRVAVDLGCGTGTVLAKMRCKTHDLIGVDGSAAMLELCRSRMPEQTGAGSAISLRIGELNHLPLADHEADFACINLVLHHLPVPAKAFPEIRRILLPGGSLFLADFLRHDDESMRVHYGDHWLGFDPDELKAALADAGFEIISQSAHPVRRNLALFIITARAINPRSKNDSTA